MYSPRCMTDGGFRIDRPIVLVGLMGAGKTTVGQRLARRLRLPFLDSDEEVEKDAGVSIREIFERQGEARFRQLERQVMARLVKEPPAVIASGGGAFVDDATRTLVLDYCIAVWIDAEIDVLVERLGAGGHRPLLDDEAPARALASLAERRTPIYAQAHLAVRSEAIDPEMMVDRILGAMKRREFPE